MLKRIGGRIRKNYHYSGPIAFLSSKKYPVDLRSRVKYSDQFRVSTVEALTTSGSNPIINFSSFYNRALRMLAISYK